MDGQKVQIMDYFLLNIKIIVGGVQFSFKVVSSIKLHNPAQKKTNKTETAAYFPAIHNTHVGPITIW